MVDNLAKEAATADEVFETIWTDYCPGHICTGSTHTSPIWPTNLLNLYVILCNVYL